MPGHLDEICRVDTSRVGEKRRELIKVVRFLWSLAQNVATLVAIAKQARHAERTGEGLKADTAADYLEATGTAHAGGGPIRVFASTEVAHDASGRCLRGAVTDPSLAAALRIMAARLAVGPSCPARLFESGARASTRRRRIPMCFATAKRRGCEVDAIVEAADDRWAVFEVNLGERRKEFLIHNWRSVFLLIYLGDQGRAPVTHVLSPAQRPCHLRAALHDLRTLGAPGHGGLAFHGGDPCWPTRSNARFRQDAAKLHLHR